MDNFEKHKFSETLQTCHDIIRNNDKLSPEASFDEISKVLFIKILWERTKHETFSKERYLKERESFDSSNDYPNQQYYQYVFEETKRAFKAESIFNKYEGMRIRENSFCELVETLESYDLSKISDDIKGIAFEKFLSKTFRGELGQFFTPRTIVDFMVSIINPYYGELICDPCCGTGGFLIKAFEYIKDRIEHDRVDVTEFEDKLKYLAQNCLFGADANPRMARTAKMNMIMHGDGHSGIHHHDGLLNVNGIFENRFDVILTNPPFGSRVSKSMVVTKDDQFMDEGKIKEYTERYGQTYLNALKQVSDNIGKPIIDLFETGKYSGGGLTEALFVERCINLLKPGGRMGIVLPDGVLNNSSLDEFRHIIEGMAKIIMIVSLPKDAFIKSGASVKSSVLFLRKFTNEEAASYKKEEAKIERECMQKYAELSTNETWNKRTEAKYLRKLTNTQKIQYNLEVRNRIKEALDYDIIVSMTEQVGVTSNENDLPSVLDYFYDYCKTHIVW